VRRSLAIALSLFGLSLPLSGAAAEPPPGAVPVAAAIAAALGPELQGYTSSARPLSRLEEITAPEVQVAITSPGLARGLQAALRAAGVKLDGGAYGVARLIGPNHFAGAFRATSKLRLLLLPAGGAPARASGQADITSFGPLVAASLSDSARLRQFQPMNVQVSERRARPGQQLLVLKIDRDFGAGLGTVSFLFGSGFIVEPDFRPLVVSSAGGRRHPRVGTHADGPKLELVYEVPRGARQLTLIEGDARWPLDGLLGSTRARSETAATAGR
jgi:hypothetical protein